MGEVKRGAEGRAADRNDLIELLKGMRKSPVVRRRRLPHISQEMMDEAIRAFDIRGYSAAVLIHSLLVVHVVHPAPKRTMPYFRTTYEEQQIRQNLESARPIARRV